LLAAIALASAAPVAGAAASDDAVYRVRRGDNLTAIARRFGSTPRDLQRHNGLASDLIHPGQRLRVPNPFRRGQDRPIRWQPPLSRAGDVLRPFGPYEKEGVLMPRTGTDVACALGAPVRCPADGVVRHVGEVAGFGMVIIVEHGDGWSTVLAPLHPERIARDVNEAVLGGDVLGVVGRPTEGDRPYLHIELRRHDKAVEPDRLLP
jgi:murein DD-endopeptidase MepM/ murein hydrolase activator NlpD